MKTHGYDIYNRMTSATGPGHLATILGGRLYYNIVGSASTTFSHDGAEIAAEYDGTGTLQQRYVRGPGFDAPVVWYEGSGTGDRRYLSADERSSIVTVTDGLSATDQPLRRLDGKSGASEIRRAFQRWRIFQSDAAQGPG